MWNRNEKNCTLNCRKQPLNLPDLFTHPDFKNINPEAFRADFCRINFDKMYLLFDIDQKMLCFKTLLINPINKHINVRTV